MTDLRRGRRHLRTAATQPATRAATHPATRAAALLAVTALGLATLVGSGGGSLGFPPCTAEWCSNTPPPPTPTASVRPERATAQVGSRVQFTVQWSHYTGTPTIQWRRSSDGGSSFTPIAGATGATLEVGPVNLADDGTVYAAALTSPMLGESVTLRARLAVSSQPGIGFSDGTFQPGDWQDWPLAGPNPLKPSQQTAQLSDGGNPGVFRQMVFTIPAGTGSGYAGYLRTGAEYSPRLQGAVKVIDYRDDCAMQPPSDTGAVESSLLMVQDGRSYVAPERTGLCAQAGWFTATLAGGLQAQDFRLFDGPPCPAGGACPDFSANGAAMRFGYIRFALASPGQTLTHGIDNWSVTVWRP